MEALWYLGTVVVYLWERPVLEVRPGSPLVVGGKFKVGREPPILVAKKLELDIGGVFGLSLPGDA